MKNHYTFIVLYFLIMISACTSTSKKQENNQSEKSQTDTTNTSPQTTPKGSVASAHPLATQAGLDVLAKGGNAFDAAIAVAATLNVVEPMMSGIGGYGTTLVYNAETKKVQFLNSSGKFPLKTNSDLMRAPTLNYMKNRVGPKSISTPGNLNAWVDMHKKYGKLPWKELFTTAIQHAEKGFEVDSFTEKMIKIAFKDFSAYSKKFYAKNNQPLKKGDTLVQTDLAKTFSLIAEKGAAPFYQGEIARAIDRQMKKAGSFLALEDLQKNEAEWWEPLKFNYRGFDVYTAALPANSFPAFVNLGLMQQFSSEELVNNPEKYYHLFAEATKESYKARLKYSFDPDIQKAPIDSILSPTVLKVMAAAFDPNKATDYTPPFSKESTNTTHFVVIDQWGNIVSATQTLGNVFGSRVMVEGTGVWLNNSMAYATYEPKGNPMDAFAGRHKLSGDCPIIILKDDLPWAALGSPGGHTITQNVPQVVMQLIDFKRTMQGAIDAPKISFVEPNYIRADHHLPQKVMESLKAKGHNLKRGNIGNAHGIKIIRDDNGKITAYQTGVDQRRMAKKPIIDR